MRDVEVAMRKRSTPALGQAADGDCTGRGADRHVVEGEAGDLVEGERRPVMTDMKPWVWKRLIATRKPLQLLNHYSQAAPDAESLSA